MFYMQDSATGKQTSLRTKDETEANSLLEARNAAQRQSRATLKTERTLSALLKLKSHIAAGRIPISRAGAGVIDNS